MGSGGGATGETVTEQIPLPSGPQTATKAAGLRSMSFSLRFPLEHWHQSTTTTRIVLPVLRFVT